MNRLKASFKVNTTQFDIDFTDKICVLYDNSGTGKTYLLTVLRDYAVRMKLKFCSFNYEAENISEQDIINIVKDKELVLFDNADLYLTNNILKICKDNSITTIISLKDVVSYDLKESGYYRVIYKDGHLVTKRCR